MVLDLVHYFRQLPAHKGNTVTLGTGFTFQELDRAPSLKVADIAGKVAVLTRD